MGQSFPQKELLETLRQDNREVLTKLLTSQNDLSYASIWEPKSRAMPIKTLEGELISPLAGQAGLAGVSAGSLLEPAGTARPGGAGPEGILAGTAGTKPEGDIGRASRNPTSDLS